MFPISHFLFLKLTLASIIELPHVIICGPFSHMINLTPPSTLISVLFYPRGHTHRRYM